MPAMDPRSIRQDAPVDPIDETLVSYLDGELEESERHALEDRLVEDASLRKRLRALQGGWELLDELPQATVRERFAETTMEMVAATVSQSLKVQQQRRPRRVGWGIAALLLAVAGSAALGFGVVRDQQSRALRGQMADLAIAERLDAFMHGEDLALMRQLADSDAWQAGIDAGRLAGGLETLAAPAQLASLPVKKRPAVLQQLPPESQRELRERWSRFSELPTDQQDRLRQVAARVQEVPDAERPRLLETMEAYAAWVQRLTPVWREAIEKAEPEKRTQVVMQAMDNSLADWQRDSSRQLTDEDRDALYVALRAIAARRLDEMRAQWDAYDRSTQEDLKRLRLADDARPREEIEGHLLNWMFTPGGFRRQYFPEQADDLLRPLEAEDFDAIEDVLSQPMRLLLDVLAPEHGEFRDGTLEIWLAEAVRFATRRPSGAETVRLRDRYRDLDERARERIDLLRPDEAIEQLQPPRPWRGPPGRRPGPGR